MASHQLDQVQLVHEVFLDRRVTKEPLVSAFRVKSDHVVNLVSLVRLVYQSRVTSVRLVNLVSVSKLVLHKLK